MKAAIEQLTAELVKARKELVRTQNALCLKYHQGKVVAYETALAILYDAKERIRNEDDNAQGNALSDGR